MAKQQTNNVPTRAGMSPADHPGNLARDSGRGPKLATMGPSPVHPHMISRQRDGTTLAGITETEVRNAPDASGQTFMDATVQKRLTPPAVSFGQRSRTSDARDLQALGRAILDSAIVSGSTRLPAIK